MASKTAPECDAAMVNDLFLTFFDLGPNTAVALAGTLLKTSEAIELC